MTKELKLLLSPTPGQFLLGVVTDLQASRLWFVMVSKAAHGMAGLLKLIEGPHIDIGGPSRACPTATLYPESVVYSVIAAIGTAYDGSMSDGVNL
ncbi:hypothetical protein OPV22_015945 [Ensete ventricosum]|uniref:Uncharacterized protein n=1 Tax=Ensete ventricosum TaxID=4639 RepID=A0AAV8PUB2_ENSVE|nr:hypothetical protein OPV22_015945 [Ensete ventricosum]